MQEDHQPVGGFTFYRFFCDAIRQLPKSKQLEMYNAICDYVFDGKEPDLKGDLLGVFWTLMKPALDDTKKTTRSKPAHRGLLSETETQKEIRRRRKNNSRKRMLNALTPLRNAHSLHLSIPAAFCMPILCSE